MPSPRIDNEPHFLTHRHLPKKERVRLAHGIYTFHNEGGSPSLLLGSRTAQLNQLQYH